LKETLVALICFDCFSGWALEQLGWLDEVVAERGI